MAVVINEFEVVTEPPPSRERTEPRPGEAPAASSVRDIERILRWQRERSARVWAH
jgi:hypothetical protein